MLLIPLSASKSRGDQILNANHFQSLGFAHVLTEDEVNLQPLSNQLVLLREEGDLLISEYVKN